MRIRCIKPEFWTHPVMARLPDEVQLLALALLCHADDEGYFMADPAIVRGACMPFRETLATISRSLAKLSQVGWIELCESEKHGQIGHVVNWEKHQRVDHARPSRIKTYFSRENFAKPRETLALDQGSGNREQGADHGDEDKTPEATHPAFKLDLKRGEWIGAQPLIPQWAATYPHINVEAELAAAAQWCMANGQRGRKSNWRAFMTNWLKRSEDKAPKPKTVEEHDFTQEELAEIERTPSDGDDDNRREDAQISLIGSLPVDHPLVAKWRSDHPDWGKSVGNEDAASGQVDG